VIGVSVIAAAPAVAPGLPAPWPLSHRIGAAPAYVPYAARPRSVV